MKTATVRDLRNDFRRVSRWIEKGETVQIVKRGKPFARVVPEAMPKRKGFLGSMVGSAKIPADFDAPMEVTWPAKQV